MSLTSALNPKATEPEEVNCISFQVPALWVSTMLVLSSLGPGDTQCGNDNPKLANWIFAS